MKYITLIFLFLASCTTPEFITLKTKNGEHIHTVTKDPFFSSPNQTSEWLFWYTPIFLIALWLIWKEIKSILVKKPSKPEDK